MTTKLKGDATGGLLDKLINGGELPPVQLQVDTETFVKLGLTIICSMVIIILVNAIIKTSVLKM